MAEGIFHKIVLWGILILFIFVFFFAFYSKDKGFITKIANIALGAERFLPVEPSKEVRQDESLPQAAIELQKNFMQEISQHRDKERCLLEFSSLTRLENLRIELSNYEGITSRIEKPVGKEGGIKLNPIATNDPQMRVCVIEPEAFYNCHLGPKDCSRQVYKSVNSVEISKDNIIIDGNSYKLGQGFLFKPDKNNLCFIPIHTSTGDSWYKIWQTFSKWGCDASKSTIDDDCLAIIQRNIPSCKT